MTTKMGHRGEIVLPKAIRVSRGFQPGDDFEIIADEDDVDLILLRRIRVTANWGLVKHLSSSPFKGPLLAPKRKAEEMSN
jgi:AbrB family looped-hinge helix DNA binding protein